MSYTIVILFKHSYTASSHFAMFLASLGSRRASWKSCNSLSKLSGRIWFYTFYNSPSPLLFWVKAGVVCLNCSAIWSSFFKVLFYSLIDFFNNNQYKIKSSKQMAVIIAWMIKLLHSVDLSYESIMFFFIVMCLIL